MNDFGLEIAIGKQVITIRRIDELVLLHSNKSITLEEEFKLTSAKVQTALNFSKNEA